MVVQFNEEKATEQDKIINWQALILNIRDCESVVCERNRIIPKGLSKQLKIFKVNFCEVW